LAATTRVKVVADSSAPVAGEDTAVDALARDVMPSNATDAADYSTRETPAAPASPRAVYPQLCWEDMHQDI
jgi:hypothetical protein